MKSFKEMRIESAEVIMTDEEVVMTDEEVVSEAHQEVSADFKVSASGRKIPVQRKNVKDPDDADGDGDVDADDEKAKKMRGESVEQIEEAVSVKKQDYSWGKMVTVHHGADTSYPLHPEHQHAIKKLKDGEHTSFTDETNRKVTAHREGDNVHLSSRDSNKKTTVAHSHFTEQTAPVAPVPDKKYIKGTPEWKANKEKNKPRTGHPTNEETELEEAKVAATQSARAELAKRPRKELTGVEAEKKKKESDDAWERLMAHAAAQKAKTNESVEQLDESKWEKTGAHGLAKDFGEDGHISTTKKTMTVRAKVHNASHSDGAPVLKNFDRKDRHSVETVTIPKGSKVVHNKANGYSYTHHPEHGHVEFEHDDIQKKEGTEMDFDSLFESVDKEDQRLMQLARLGLVDSSNVSKLRAAVTQLKGDKQLSMQQRTLILSVFEDLIGLVTGDDQLFRRVKMDVQKEGTEQKTSEEDPPFDPDPPKKTKSATPGKFGSGYSTARHLARLALAKQQKKQQGK